MTANKCDRCGTLYEKKYTPDVRINIYIHPYGAEWVNLCPKCQEMLENFVSICWQEKSRNKLVNYEQLPEKVEKEATNDICEDNRFEIIEHYKSQMIESTNIETSPDEMAVLDNILFRFWQMGWLKEQEAVEPKCKIIFDVPYYFCGKCKTMLNMYAVKATYCSNCGKRVKWK